MVGSKNPKEEIKLTLHDLLTLFYEPGVAEDGLFTATVFYYVSGSQMLAHIFKTSNFLFFL